MSSEMIELEHAVAHASATQSRHISRQHSCYRSRLSVERLSERRNVHILLPKSCRSVMPSCPYPASAERLKAFASAVVLERHLGLRILTGAMRWCWFCRS
jgi:hypothetical protein